MAKTRIIMTATGLLLAALVAAGVWGALKAMRVMEMARELKADVGTLKAEMTAVDDVEDIPAALEAGRAALPGIEAKLAELQREVEPFEPLLLRLGWVPEYGDDLVAVPHLLDVVEALLQTANHLDAGLMPFIGLAEGDFSGADLLPQAAAAAEQAQPHLESARPTFDEARAAREAIGDASGLVPELREAVDDADQALALVDRGLAAAQTYLPPLSPLLGMHEPHHVLVLVQNAHELRPTGGWITSSIYFVIESGRVVEVDVIHSSDPRLDRFGGVVYEEPPLPLRDYMHLPIWAFRDANWSPDFPTSARQAVHLYTSAVPREVDTVIAINQFSLAELLRATGPLPLWDGSMLAADNASAVFRLLWMEYLTEQGAVHRKDFITDLTPVLLERLLTMDSLQSALVRWRTVTRAAETGDLLVYSTMPEVQALIEMAGWDGSIPATRGDYLYVVDSNTGINKTDLNVERRGSYHVSLVDPTRPYALLEREYVNNSPGLHGRACPGGQRYQVYEDIADDCYVNYLRVYLPDDSLLTSAPRFSIPASFTYVDDPAAGQVHSLPDERGKEVFGGLMVVLPGETVETNINYRLDSEQIFTVRPDGALVYTLLVQKQPGVPPYPLAVTIDLPTGAEVLEISPAPTYSDSGTVYFERTHDMDFAVEVVMRVPDVPEDLPLEATPAATPTPRILPTLAPLPLVPPTVTPTPTPEPTAEP